MSDSIWKKEIHLRRPKQPKEAKQPKQEKPASETSVWKKELHLRKQPEPMPPLPAHLLDRSRVRTERPRGHVTVPVLAKEEVPVEPVQRVERWTARVPAPHTAFPKTAAGEGPDPVALLPRQHATVDPAPAVPSLPAPPEPIGWDRQLPAVSTPEPAAVVVEPEPVEVEVEPAPVDKVPLLKRELHLRKPKLPKEPKQPKTAKEPKAAKEPKTAKEPKAAKEPKPPKEPKEKRERHEKAVRVVGLRIGSSQLAAAHVRNNGSAEVVQLARVPLERGVVINGEVRDSTALAKALKSFFAENKLPRKDIRLGVSSNRIGVRVLDVPAVDDAKQFENAIRFQAQEALPIPVTDAVLDHVVLGEHVGDEGDVMRRVLLVFAHRELVSRYVDACRQAGLRLRGIDLDAFALLRAIGPGEKTEGRRASVVVGIGHERTVFAVSDGDICDFTRVLEWGSGAIDIAVARALGLAPSEAEPIKRRLDLDAAEPPEGLSAMQFEAARAAASSEIGHLVRELLSSLRFYQSRPDSLDIAEIVVSGGGANLAGFQAELQRGLGAPVRVADPLARVTLGKKVSPPEDPGSLAIAVGLGMGA